MTATTASQHLRAGSAASGPYALEVTPESAGWGHSGLRVLELPAGGRHVLDGHPKRFEDSHILRPLTSGDAPGRYRTTVTMTFEPLDDGQRTLVSISEEGWRDTEAGLKSSYGNCQGWTQMLCALKAYKEYGVNLRDGMFK